MGGFVNPVYVVNTVANCAGPWDDCGFAPEAVIEIGNPAFLNPTTPLTYFSNTTVPVALTGPIPPGQNQIGLVTLTNNPLPSGSNMIGVVGLAADQTITLASPITLDPNTTVTLASEATVAAMGVDPNGAQHGLSTDTAGALAPTRSAVSETVINLPAGASTQILGPNALRFLWKVQTTTNDEVIISESGLAITDADSAGTLLSGRGSVYAPVLAQTGAITAYCITAVALRVTEYSDVSGPET